MTLKRIWSVFLALTACVVIYIFCCLLIEQFDENPSSMKVRRTNDFGYAMSNLITSNQNIHSSKITAALAGHLRSTQNENNAARFQNETAFTLGVFNSRNTTSWTRLTCETTSKYRLAKLPTKFGEMNLYVYDSDIDDLSITAWALKGEIPEKEEIESFLEATNPLPVIDVGANLGTVALQAALQKRQVVALEPVYSNAARLCRSALDFGLDLDLRVLLNAASSSEGEVTLDMDFFQERARYLIQTGPRDIWQPRYDPVKAYAIKLDTLLEVLPFTAAVLKIDVEGHEGHVLAGAERLFQQLYIPFVWLEWEHVKHARTKYGGEFIIAFMRARNMEPRDVVSGERLSTSDFEEWPSTVLWKHEE